MASGGSEQEQDLIAGLSYELARTNMLLDGIARAQTSFILSGQPGGAFQELLTVLLESTLSEYGFIGEVFRDPDGTPWLRTHAITDISWNEETRAFYEANAVAGFEFRNLETLFGAVLTSGRTVLSNDPSSDSRAGGRPHGHPPLDAFLGVPIFSQGEFVGMVGLANREGGYTEDVARWIEPILLVAGNFISGLRADRERKLAEACVRERDAKLRVICEQAGLGIWEWSVASGDVRYSDLWCAQLGYRADELEHAFSTWERLVHPDDLGPAKAAVGEHLSGASDAFRVVTRMRHRDGRWVHILSSGQVLARDESGAPIQMLGLHLDVSHAYAEERAA